jgi:hypothetical protein
MIGKCIPANDVKNGGGFAYNGGTPVSGNYREFAWTQTISNLDQQGNAQELTIPKDLTYPVISSSGDWNAASAANVDAIVHYAASGHHLIYKIDWSYAGSGSLNGGLVVKDGSNTLFRSQITNFGAGFNEWAHPNPIMGTYNTAMTVILQAGGLGASGVINKVTHRVLGA